MKFKVVHPLLFRGRTMMTYFVYDRVSVTLMILEPGTHIPNLERFIFFEDINGTRTA